MNETARVYVHALRLNARLIFFKIFYRLFRSHAPRKRGIAAERLLIEEISPAADRLAYHNGRGDSVKNSQ